LADLYRCDACGFEYEIESAEHVGPLIVDGVAGITALAGDTGAAVHGRRQPDVWSPLEYTCHLRDVLLVQRERVLAARRTDRPECAPMGRDERVEHDGYAGQDPEDVVRQLTDAAAMFANVLDQLQPADWDRRVVYSYPKPWERSLRWVAVHTLHEVRHHRLDIEGQVGEGGR
jgi:hypothetical protein